MAHHKSSDPSVFILPDLGEGVHEPELIKWRVEVGQAVAEHEILAEMETDKALVEVPSPRGGVIAELHGRPGETLKVGTVLVTYQRDNGAAPPKPAPRAAEPAPRAAAPEPAAEEREDAGTVVGLMSGAAAGTSASGGKALATPAVRRLARDLGADIDAISGTGIGGRVLEKDVRAAVSGGTGGPPVRSVAPGVPPVRSAAPGVPPVQPPSPRPAAPGPDEVTRIPFRGVRRTIANRLRQSIDQAVHFTVVDEVDVTALDGLRRRLAAASGEKVTFLPFICSAVCRTLAGAEFRAMNATVDEEDPDAAEIIQHRSVHMGIATDTDSGLMVPVVRDADRMGVLELGRAITLIAESARNRTIPREHLIGSTFTISNVGSHAGKFATPIINYPEVAILGVGRAREGVVVEKGAFRIGLIMPLSIACDHRVVDGATAAMALARIMELLKTPDQLMAPARG